MRGRERKRVRENRERERGDRQNSEKSKKEYREKGRRDRDRAWHGGREREERILEKGVGLKNTVRAWQFLPKSTIVKVMEHNFAPLSVRMVLAGDSLRSQCYVHRNFI